MTWICPVFIPSTLGVFAKLNLNHSLSTTFIAIPLSDFHHRHFFISRNNHRRCICNFSVSSATCNDLQYETLKTLEWDRLCTHLTPFTSTSMGKSAAQTGSIPMGRTLEESCRLLDQTTAVLELSSLPDFSGIDDVSDIIRSAASGEVLSIGELCAIKRTLRSARRLFEQLEEFCPGDR